jgi:sigma-E factor negative regulatory protein RseA
MKERLSALMDEELGEAEADSCLGGLAADESLRETWGVYHLIGDALRGHVGPSLPSAFAQRLAAEPTVLAPGRAVRGGSRTQRHVLAAAASVAAVALVAWTALPLFAPPPEIASAKPAPVLATAAVSPAPIPPAPIPPAQGVADYLLAHQRFSPSASMVGIAPYVRTVSEAREAR